MHKRLGVQARKRRDGAGKKLHAVIEAHAHLYVCGEMLLACRQLRLQRIFELAHLAGVARDDGAGLRGLDAGRGALEKLLAVIGLDGGQTLREAGARHVELVGRPRKAARLFQRKEYLGIGNFHGSPFSP